MKRNKSSVRRAVVFAHFDKDDIVDDYIIYYLRSLKQVCDYLVFVTTSSLPENEISKVNNICDQIIFKENVGYDFMSWQVGIKSIANLCDYDELIVCNDSVYGPFFSLKDIFDAMSKRDCDFWGITENYEIAYHLQSYFLVFKKNVISSETFNRFWGFIKVEKTKHEIIKKYEVGLTQTLMAAGFKPFGYIKYYHFLKFLKRKAVAAFNRGFFETIRILLGKRQEILQTIVDKRKINPTLFYWRELIVKYRMPFLKIGLVRDNPSKINIERYEDIIMEHFDYNIDLIKNHLKRVKF